jgi:hypothetical protein
MGADIALAVSFAYQLAASLRYSTLGLFAASIGIRMQPLRGRVVDVTVAVPPDWRETGELNA